MGTCDRDANGEATSGDPTRARVRMREAGAEQRVVAMKSPIKGWSQGAVSRIRLIESTSNGRNSWGWVGTSCLSEMTFST